MAYMAISVLTITLSRYIRKASKTNACPDSFADEPDSRKDITDVIYHNCRFPRCDGKMTLE